MIEWVFVHWESVALAAVPLLAVHFCWGFRENMNGWAWAFFAIFTAMFFASNAFRFVPVPDERTVETALRWSQDVRLYSTIGHKACAVAALWVAFFASMGGKMKGATALLCATVLAAMFGEFLEFSYCRLRDPVRGFDHIYLLEGGRNSACGRLVEFGIHPRMAWLGSFFMPTITVFPSVVAMWWTAYVAKQRKRKRPGK